MVTIIKNKFFEEIVFFIALSLAVFTSLFAKLDFAAIDLNVLGILATLMLITLAFEKYEVLDSLSVWVLKNAESERKTTLMMIVLSAVLGMFITNDVALITVVPISISVAKRAGFDPFKLIVLEAIAANIGSSLTPFGNPQNLFLYNYYQFDFFEFIRTVAPFVCIGMVLLLIPAYKMSNVTFKKIHFDKRLKSFKWVSVYGLLFFIAIVWIVLRMNIFYLLLPVSLCIIFKDRELFRQLDYYLLGTFICFFIFVDNMNQFIWIKELIVPWLNSDLSIFMTSAILSQSISNVPAAILLSTFIEKPNALLIGVNVGGLGTMIASLANLIAFKYYAKQFDKKQYLIYFMKLNFTGLLIFILLYCIVLS
jgi:Na+/H+ antiporter NhaD/arsenite permease-like protein